MALICLIGDVHTVNAFRICGLEGVYANEETAPAVLDALAGDDGTAVILVTRELAHNLTDTVKKFNLESSGKVIIEIPGIDDTQGPGRSLTSYITEALGVAL